MDSGTTECVAVGCVCVCVCVCVSIKGCIYGAGNHTHLKEPLRGSFQCDSSDPPPLKSRSCVSSFSTFLRSCCSVVDLDIMFRGLNRERTLIQGMGMAKIQSHSQAPLPCIGVSPEAGRPLCPLVRLLLLQQLPYFL